ncbi:MULTISPECIES: hypothetical protein [unclassified Wenzhouxiangella]|uniref:hypothetical protein n=1 Tax=unclassified Wenzhouxiangella TaxID=2613841 RepID=UPI000E32CEA4|nr:MULTISPECIES: hypothetical protein [unclassified Wenzhouxiangella]RFF27640.1 hypothetical protein DZK25_07180 [Wenzhouxiangella sp. 15181]RFP70163.1 hypothetical protein DZK26_01185 [Wenzhouxiangella sp. 15190]
MGETLHYHRILLVRARPGSDASLRGQRRVEAWRNEKARMLVFFHGEGVEHADGEPSTAWRRLAGWHGVSLAVCSGSWIRRHDQPPPEPFVLSSLVEFWNVAIDAREVACFGVADDG